MTWANFLLTALLVRGQGYRDDGEDVRLFRKAVFDGKVAPTKSLLLRATLLEARTVGDPAGNHKLAKNTQGERSGRCGRSTVKIDSRTRRVLEWDNKGKLKVRL